jgi:hypothetical protein
VRASAPGGSDSTRTTALAVDPTKSMLGMLGQDNEPHAASARPHATTAKTRLMIVTCIGNPVRGAKNDRISPQPGTIGTGSRTRNRSSTTYGNAESKRMVLDYQYDGLVA